MPTKVERWLCNICQSPYDNEKMALGCEAKGVPKNPFPKGASIKFKAPDEMGGQWHAGEVGDVRFRPAHKQHFMRWEIRIDQKVRTALGLQQTTTLLSGWEAHNMRLV